MSKQIVSTWLKKVVQLAYEAKGLPPPGRGKVKGHDIRMMATSWADVAGVDPTRICEAATWKSENMFAQFYRLNLFPKSRTTSAERALESSLGPSVKPPCERKH